jgi:hypothetical protein
VVVHKAFRWKTASLAASRASRSRPAVHIARPRKYPYAVAR